MEAIHPIMSLSHSPSRPLLYTALSRRHFTPTVQVATGRAQVVLWFDDPFSSFPRPRDIQLLFWNYCLMRGQGYVLSELGDMRPLRYSRNRAAEVGSCGVLLGLS